MSNRLDQQEDTHFRVLHLLQNSPGLSQRELAENLGISLGKANYCLRALLDKGLIKINNFKNSQNKLAYTYVLTPAGFIKKAKTTTGFLKRKLIEYERLKAEIESLKSELCRSAQVSRKSLEKS